MRSSVRTAVLTLLVAVFSITTLAVPAAADQFVKGYFKSDGTYVRPHYRSDPDGIPENNYSFPGNRNPYTGNVAPGNPDTYLKNYYGYGSGTGLGTGGLDFGDQ